MFEIDGLQYRLPCRSAAVYQTLLNDPKVPYRLTTQEQATRVAWRIVRSWVEAQLAIIETGMVAAEEVFLPYRLVGDGQTVYEVYQRSDRLLTDGSA